jgi:ABC-2 type transport system ATP-binding protein
MIEIKGVSKSFGATKALDRVDLTLNDGVTGLVGENGAGKSTLLRCIAGVLNPEEGRIIIDGLDRNEIKAKSEIYFLSDFPYSPPSSTIDKVYEFYSCFYDFDLDRFHEILTHFSLPPKGAINNFSKGMRRQLFVALALSAKTRYLLMDEAFDGLDPIALDAIKGEIISEKENGRTILISSHNIATLEKLADRFVMLSSGRLSLNEENHNLGRSFVKYQAFFENNPTELELASLCSLISYRKIGSVLNFVIEEDEEAIAKIKDAYKPKFIEMVNIDSDELVTLAMIKARKESEK